MQTSFPKLGILYELNLENVPPKSALFSSHSMQCLVLFHINSLSTTFTTFTLKALLQFYRTFFYIIIFMVTQGEETL